jgi:hypothetical protein
MSEFRKYIEHGWKLIPILPGHKGPKGAAARDWNKIEKAVTNPAHRMHSAGLAHAYSGTCAIDVDDYPKARDWLMQRGVDLDVLFLDPRSVQIHSGKANHGKLLYALDTPLASKQIKDDGKAVIDFRCATAAGRTVQDVLPPSMHPDTGRPYAWVYGNDLIGDWHDLPPLDEQLKNIWLQEISDATALLTNTSIPEKGAAPDELRTLLMQHDPNMNRDEWIKVGMAIHHETSGSMEGLHLWNEWSSNATDKYAGIEDLKVCWRSFHDTPGAVTVGMLRQGAAATLDDFDVVEEAAEVDPWTAAAKSKAAKFNMVHVAEVAKREPPQWLIEDVLPKQDLAMLYGESGSGKSFVALDIAFAIATGFDWNDLPTEKHPVVWIAAEAAGSMRNRTKAYAQAKGIELENADLWVIGETPSLMDTEESVALAEAVRAKKPGLIIVDTLAAASIGANENSGEDMNIVMGACRMLHETTGALVMLIHHTGKDLSRGARGWSGIKGAMHTEMTVSYHQDMRKFEVTKQRDGEEGQAWPFRLMIVNLDLDGLTSCYVEMLDKALLNNENAVVSKLGPTQKLVLECVYQLIKVDGGGAPVAEIHDAVLRKLPQKEGQRNRGPELVNRTLIALQSRGILELEDNIVRLASDEPV